MSLACAAFAAAPQAASRLLARSPVPARSHLRCRRPECSLSAPGRPVLHPLLQRANAATVDGVCSAVDVIYAAPDAAWRRFYTLEVLARIPFFAYACLLHLRETLIGPSELATRRLRQHFEQSDNEALHLAVMCVAGRPRWIDRFLAAHLGLVYFGTSVLVFLASPAVAFHFNELVEIHAYDTYDKVSGTGDSGFAGTGLSSCLVADLEVIFFPVLSSTSARMSVRCVHVKLSP